MDISIVSRQSSRNFAISTVLWSCLGGVQTGNGIQQIFTNYHSFRWINSFLFGVVGVGLGILWAVMLLRRVKS
jgi:hypothetical protein